MPACSSSAAARNRGWTCPHSPPLSRAGRPIPSRASRRASMPWLRFAWDWAPPSAHWLSSKRCLECLTTSRGDRGCRRPRRAVEEEALHEVDAQLLHSLELFRPLHALGDHHRAVIVRELHHRLDEILLDEVRIVCRLLLEKR